MSPVWYYVVFLYMGAVGMLGLGITSIARRRTVLSVYFAVFCLSVAVYSFGYGMELTRTTEYSLRMWSRVQYVGLSFTASLLVLFVLHFVNSRRRIPNLLNVLPILMSALFLVVRQTNSVHHLFYRDYLYRESGDFLVMGFDKGPWYWIFAAYNVLCMVGTAVLIVFYMMRTPRTYQRQTSWLLTGSVIPLIPYIVYVTGGVPGGYDIIPGSIILASVTYYIAIFRHDLFSLIPVGRDQLVESMPEAVFVLNSILQVADVNPAARQAFCPDGTEPIGRHIDEVFPSLSKLKREPEHIHQNGRIWEMVQIPVSNGRKSSGYLILGHDVTEREELVTRLERAAREDALTGLLNRHSWDDAVNTELARLSRHGRFGSIIYMDLDGFKTVNDSYGHGTGDSVLKAVSRVLKRGLRRPDLVGRYGGEEFVLFLPEIHPEAAFDVAERLRVDLYEEIKADMSVDVIVTGSFGVAGGIITDDITLEELIQKADKAMYESKKGGKNRVSWNRN